MPALPPVMTAILPSSFPAMVSFLQTALAIRCGA
jgi:hypothetical protein